MPVRRLGDPNFTIDAPTNGTVLGPTFSVNGWGPQNMTNISASLNGSVGNTTQPATQEPNGFCWEAIFTGMASGSYTVTASSSAGTIPVAPVTINVNIDSSPGVTIGPLTPPQPTMGEAADPPNPWAGWKVEGSFDPAKFKSVFIYLTHRGVNVNVGAGEKAWGEATLDVGTRRWTCNLGFVPPGFRGKGFLIHYNAHRHDGQIIHGSLAAFFDGPPANTNA